MAGLRPLAIILVVAWVVSVPSRRLDAQDGPQDATFRRADSNSDGSIDLSDAVFTLRGLFVGGTELACRDAADANDDGLLNIADPLYSLNFLFRRGDVPPEPGRSCGPDPTDDALDCIDYTECVDTTPLVGQSQFETPIAGSDGGLFLGGVDDAAGGVPEAQAPPTNQRSGDVGSETPAREVEEADIYRLDGERLFVLNRYRGLQILDLSDVDEPELVGSAAIFGFPREMYIRGDRAYVIVSDYFKFWRDEDAAADGFFGSEVRVLDISDPTMPVVIGGTDVVGDISDSRLVGDILYVVSKRWAYRYGHATDDDQNTTDLLAIDVSDPDDVHDVDRESFPREGYEHHITATSDTIYLSESFYDRDLREYRSAIHYIDIGDPTGDILVRDSAEVPGRVHDRWSMDSYNGVLRVASGQGWGNGDVHLSTFSVENPDEITRLARYTMPIDEALTSVRFSGDRGYIVTFRRIDPLFVFDLVDPAKPKLLGELEMTGWLDFMIPDGDRVYALGHDDLVDGEGRSTRNLAVSIVDVADGSDLKLASRVILPGSYGSLPTWDRDDFGKVIKKLDDQGLIMFPFQAWDPETYRLLSGVQLVDFDRDNLALRGVVEGGLVQRAASFDDTTIVTIANEVVQTVDISDRDEPDVRGSVELARNVQSLAVLPGGQYSVQLAGDWYRGDAQLLVTPFDDPDTPEPVASIDIAAPYGRMFVNGSYIYVASVQTVLGPKDEQRQATTVEVIDFSNPREPARRGSVELPDLIWPSYFFWYWGYGDEVVQLNGSTLAFHRAPFYFFLDCFNCRGGFQGEQQRLIHLVDLENPDDPVVASTIKLDTVHWSWGLRAVASTLYLSTYVSSITEKGSWVARYHLHRWGVSDPAAPDAKTPVSIPGMFVGASEAGDRAYTVENRWDARLGQSRNVFYSLALEDERAVLLSSVEIPGYANSFEIREDAAFTVANEWILDQTTEFGRWRNIVHLLSIDLGDSSDVSIADSTEVPFGYGFLQKVDGDRAFVGSDSGIFLYDVADIDDLGFVKFFRTQGWSQDVVVHEDTAFVPSGFFGVQVLDLTPDVEE